MSRQSTTWWLELDNGTRLRVGPAGILIGRRPDCDLVLTEDRASRLHAIVHPTADGVGVVPLGRHAPEINGEAVSAETRIATGARLSFPGLTVTVASVVEQHDDDEPAWVLQHRGGGTFGVSQRGLTVGEGSEDDLRIPGCPASGAIFHVAGGQLLVEAGAALEIRGRRTPPSPLPVGGIAGLARGSIVQIGDVEIEVIVGGATLLDTTAGSPAAGTPIPLRPTAVRLQFLPRGGRLYVDYGAQTNAAYLAGRRCDLAACLLQPPEPYQPGEALPDDVVIPRVWPGGTATRSNVGVLIHRLRRDLVQAGLDGVALIVREEGGGATRFAVPPGVGVSVE